MAKATRVAHRWSAKHASSWTLEEYEPRGAGRTWGISTTRTAAGSIVFKRYAPGERDGASGRDRAVAAQQIEAEDGESRCAKQLLKARCVFCDDLKESPGGRARPSIAELHRGHGRRGFLSRDRTMKADASLWGREPWRAADSAGLDRGAKSADVPGAIAGVRSGWADPDERIGSSRRLGQHEQGHKQGHKQGIEDRARFWRDAEAGESLERASSARGRCMANEGQHRCWIGYWDNEDLRHRWRGHRRTVSISSE